VSAVPVVWPPLMPAPKPVDGVLPVVPVAFGLLKVSFESRSMSVSRE
jgi:hypothetical protein